MPLAIHGGRWELRVLPPSALAPWRHTRRTRHVSARLLGVDTALPADASLFRAERELHAEDEWALSCRGAYSHPTTMEMLVIRRRKSIFSGSS